MDSIRTGTVAATMPNQIDEKIKNIRVNAVLNLAKKISKENHKNMVGKVFEAFVDKILDNGTGEAILDSGKNVDLISNNLTNEKLNNFVNVKIISFSNNKFVGEVI